MVVFTLANGMFRSCVSCTHSSGLTARRVKYMANRPAKNMSSLDSQTMVPTETMLGRFAGVWAYADGMEGAVATRGVCQIFPHKGDETPRIAHVIMCDKSGGAITSRAGAH